jgi:hypothetical protein
MWKAPNIASVYDGQYEFRSRAARDAGLTMSRFRNSMAYRVMGTSPFHQRPIATNEQERVPDPPPQHGTVRDEVCMFAINKSSSRDVARPVHGRV